MENYLARITRDLENPRSAAYRLIRGILQSKGHWKNLPRGVPITQNLTKLPRPTVVQYNDADFVD